MKRKYNRTVLRRRIKSQFSRNMMLSRTVDVGVFLCYVLKLKQIALLARHRANNDRQAVISASHIRGALKIYCDMDELDGGGWTLVWQHSYMEDLPLSKNMTFFSDHYKSCTTRASGWCNIPNKARFSEAAEQMIVAYHKGTVVYTYKGLFNRNIDYNWSGAILLDFVKIVDKCKLHNGIQPAPVNNYVVGLAFDKLSPYDYKSNYDTYYGSFTNPGDNRFGDCRVPSYLSSKEYDVQMTIAIFMC